MGTLSQYVPSNASELANWLQNFVAQLTVHAVTLGVLPADIAPLGTARLDLSDSIANQVAKKAAWRSATTDKNEDQQTAVSLIRSMVNRIVESPNMTDQIRRDLGLPVPSENVPSNEIGTEIPEVSLDSLNGAVIVHFGTNPLNERLNSRPAWARGGIIYRRKMSEPDYQMVGFSTSSPFRDLSIVGPGTDYMYMVRYHGKTANDVGLPSREERVAAGGAIAA